MKGRVEQAHALLPVVFRLDDRGDLTIEFVVDTGYTGALALPTPAIAAMRLPFREETSALLADDTEVILRTHLATILWHGEEIQLSVLAAGHRPLLGTALLEDCALSVQFVEGGLVDVAPI
jgi:clan AA aspartic protease